MKNKIRGFLFLFLALVTFHFPMNLKAAHFYGYDVNWKNLGNDTFEIKVTFYHDCSQSASSSNTINLISDSCNSQYNINFLNSYTSTSTEITPVCIGTSTPCNMTSPQFPFGLWKKVFYYKQYLGGNFANCCWYRIQLIPSSGSPSITTMNGVIFTRADFWLNRCISNNTSPTFANDPLSIKIVNQDAIYSNGVYDLDGDSVSYELSNPNNQGYWGVWNKKYPLTCFGGNLLPPNPNTSPIIGYNFDSINGTIKFHPTVVQNTVIKINVLEWRKINSVYKVIGKTFRENIIQIYASNSNASPTITTPVSYEFYEGLQNCVNINTTDANLTDTTKLTSNCNTLIPGSTFTITTSSLSSKAKANFCWTPDTGKLNERPYLFNVEIRDNKCVLFGSNIYTYSIKVIKPPTIETEIKRKSCYSYDAIGKASKQVLNSSSRWEIYFLGRLKNNYSNQDSIRLELDSSGTYIFKYTYSNSGYLLTKYDTINYTAPPFFQINSSKDTTVCKNSTLLLSTTPLGGEAPFKYEWRLDSIIIDTTQTISISVKDSAQYIVKVISGDSCHLFAYDTILIKVDTSYLAINKLNDTIICKGNSFQLSPTITYGKSPFSYFWYKNNSLVSTNTVFADNPINTSTYVLKVVSSDNCYNTVYDTVIINVDSSQIEVITLNDIVLCIGATLNLTPTILKGKSPLNYFWYKNNVLISTNDTLSEIPSSAATYSLKIVSSDQCYNTFLDTVNVSFFPKTLQLKLLNDTTICVNTPFTLKAQVSGASSYNYNWCPQGKTCSALPNPIYSFDATTQIILDVSSNDNCFETKRDTMMVHVFPLKQLIISASSTTINKGQTTVIKASNGNSFSWTGNNIVTNWGDSILVKPTVNSTYRSIGINANGCVDTSEITILVTNVGFNKSSNDENNLLIYPNPAKDELIVSGNFSENENSVYSIKNILGETLITGILSGDKTIINIGNLSKGIYIIKVGSEVRKFIKE